MGLMTGKITDNQTMIVMDSFALPVEGTETRVNAAQEGYEYMVSFLENLKKMGRLENVIGWYCVTIKGFWSALFNRQIYFKIGIIVIQVMAVGFLALMSALNA